MPDTQITELAGRHYLISQLLAGGVEVALPVRDRGIDLIAYLDRTDTGQGFLACPIQLKANQQARFSLDRKYAQFHNLLMVYAWKVSGPAPELYALTYAEAEALLQKTATQKPAAGPNSAGTPLPSTMPGVPACSPTVCTRQTGRRDRFGMLIRTIRESMLKHLVPLLTLAASTLAAQTSASSEMQADRAHRDPAIHWPAAYSPSVAPVFSHNELLLHTSCHHAFARFTDAPSWPAWFPLIADVHFDTPAPFRQGTLLRFRIFGNPDHARVTEFVPDERVSWAPFNDSESETHHSHFHTWHFVPQADGCRVITEETGIGPQDAADPATRSHFMHQAHDLWLAGLRYTAEP